MAPTQFGSILSSSSEITPLAFVACGRHAHQNEIGVRLLEKIEIRFSDEKYAADFRKANAKATSSRLTDSPPFFQRPLFLEVGGCHRFLRVSRANGQPLIEIAFPYQPAGNVARRLINGDRIPVRYLSSDPNRVIYSHDAFSSSWGSLLGGIAAIFTAFVSSKLLPENHAG